MLELDVEHVLVVPTSVFHELGHFQGFNRDTARYLRALLECEQLGYRPRPDMERDASFKQLIPYCVFRHTDQAGRVSIFQYTRGNGQGEGRLHAKQSIGVGGHISSIDAEREGAAPYAEGLWRELTEEVAIDTPYRESCVGLINDDETEVGRVHLGVVHLFDVERPAVTPREAEMVDCGFRSVESLLADTSRFETWSKICLEALFGERGQSS